MLWKTTCDISHSALNTDNLLVLSYSNKMTKCVVACMLYNQCLKKPLGGNIKSDWHAFSRLLWQQKQHHLNIILALLTHKHLPMHLLITMCLCVCFGRVSLRKRRARSSSIKSRNWRGCRKSPRDYLNSTQTSLEPITSKWSRTPIRWLILENSVLFIRVLVFPQVYSLFIA